MSAPDTVRTRASKLVTVVQLIGGIALQAESIRHLANTPIETELFIAMHVGGAVFITLALHRIFIGKHYGKGHVVGLMILGTALLMPVAGGLMATIFLLMLRGKHGAVHHPGHVVWEDRGEHCLPGHTVTKELDAMKPSGEEELILTRIHRRSSPYAVASELLTKLGDSSPIIRREAVLGIAQLRQEQAVSILKTVLDDPDEQVRLMAQNALRRICERHDRIIDGFRETLQRDSENPFYHLRLAETYFSLAELDAENDESIANAHRAKAASFVALAMTNRENLVAKEPEIALELSIRLLRRSLTLARLDPARRYARQLLKAGVKDPRFHESLIELAYETKDWPTMINLLKQLPAAPISSPNMRTTARFWLDENA